MKRPARGGAEGGARKGGREKLARAKPPKPDLGALERALGHVFADRALLERALTHSSYAEAAGRPAAREEAARPDNQRLEFLGDRVLGLLTAEALLARHPQAVEGDLAPRLNALVRRETCAEIAETLEVGAHLRLARSEAMTGGRRKSALLGDAMEAIIAAVYQDGGMAAAQAIFERHWGPLLERQQDEAAPIDAKTALQEWAQGRGLAPPLYALVARDGPDHAPRFSVAATLSTGEEARADGASKRAAEQSAAAALLARMLEGAAK